MVTMMMCYNCVSNRFLAYYFLDMSDPLTSASGCSNRYQVITHIDKQ